MRLKTIACDVPYCRKRVDVDFESISWKNLYKVLRSDGWTITGICHICPECRAKGNSLKKMRKGIWENGKH